MSRRSRSAWSQLGLRTRISLLVVLLTFASTVAMALAAYGVQANDTRERFRISARANFASDLRQAAEIVSSTRADRVKVVANYLNGRLGIRWAVLDFPLVVDEAPAWAKRRYLPSAGTAGMVEGTLPNSVVDGARAGAVSEAEGAGVGGTPYFIIGGRVAPDLVLVEFYGMSRLDDELQTLELRFGGIAAVIAALAGTAGFVAAGRLQRPVRTAALAARKLGAGALQTRLPVEGRDELADLAGSFNLMAERLGESIEQLRAKDKQQRRFIADVAHDLRTPVMSMIASTDSLGSQDGQTRARAAELVAAQARRLGRLVEDLLEMSRFDAGAAELLPEPVDLPGLVTDAVELSAPGAEVRVAASGDTVVVADPRRLHTIVRNLLTNAVQHGAEPITVTVDGTAASMVTLRVADSGSGVPDELAPVVFDRFARGDRARRVTEGSGLGLAIAHENALLHGGSLTVTNSGGAVFTLTLPREAVAEQSHRQHGPGTTGGDHRQRPGKPDHSGA